MTLHSKLDFQVLWNLQDLQDDLMSLDPPSNQPFQWTFSIHDESTLLSLVLQGFHSFLFMLLINWLQLCVFVGLWIPIDYLFIINLLNVLLKVTCLILFNWNLFLIETYLWSLEMDSWEIISMNMAPQRLTKKHTIKT